MKTKYIVGATLFLFWAVVTALITTSLLLYEKNKSGMVDQNITSTSTTTEVKIILTVAEVAKHNTSSNCWMIISGKVYNITSFFGSHPGGNRALASSCGTDATTAFNTKGGQGSHSQGARAMLAPFYIGDSGSEITTQAISNTTQTSPLPRRGNDEDDD